MKKVVLTVNIMDGMDKRKAFKCVASILGIDSVTVDMKQKHITVIGDVDPVTVAKKLRNAGWETDILSFGENVKETKEQKKMDCPKIPREQRMIGSGSAYNSYNNPYITQRYHDYNYDSHNYWNHYHNSYNNPYITQRYHDIIHV